MRILLLQDPGEVREKIVFFLESTFGAMVDEVHSLQAAMETMASAVGASPVDLVVHDMKPKDAEKGLMDAFWKVCGTTPVIRTIAGKIEDAPPVDANVVGFIYKQTFMENLIAKINDLVQRGVLKIDGSMEQNLCRIRTKLLLAVAPLKGDIYIKLNDAKFIKLFKQGDVFSLEDMEKYTIKKGVEYLYIRREQIKEFADKYKSDLTKHFGSGTPPLDAAAEMADSVHETVQELSKHIGFTKEVQELARQSVQATMKSMGKTPKLADILQKLRASEGQYIASHSTLTGYLACAIASQMQWGSETTFHKLTLAAFLHDIALSNHDLAAVENHRELDKILKESPTKFTADEIKDYKNHPIKGAEIAKSFSEVPADVDVIIVQHHERPDATGFPRGMNHQYIAPLSSVFIVAHDLARTMITMGEKFDVGAFLTKYKPAYQSSQFKKIMAMVEVLHQIKGIAKGISARK